MKKHKLFIPAVFLFMLFYFTVLHPIPIMDGDDMIYIMHMRPAVPIPFSWNPSRVLPEVLMPLCGNIAGMLTVAGFGTFINCQVFTLAFILSAFISFYVYCCLKLLESRMMLGKFASVCLSILFLMLHFTIFRTEDSYNLYLFKSYDACCIFYYTIPALLSSSLAMLFFCVDYPAELIMQGSIVKRATVVSAIYFCIFSNLFGSIIFAAYMGCRLLFKAIKAIRSKSTFKTFFVENYIYISIVGLWLVALALDYTGVRASSLTSSDGAMTLGTNLAKSTSGFFTVLLNTSILFKLLLGASVLGAVLVVVLFHDKKERLYSLSVFVIPFLYGAISAMFIVLLAAVSDPSYINRPEVALSAFSPIITAMVLCIAIILRKFRFLELLLPIVLIFTFTMTNTDFQTFADSNPINIDGDVALAIQNDICQQIISGAESGADEITVYVLQTDDYAANWPHNLWHGKSFTNFFLKYGIIEKPVEITIVPSMEFNEKYGVYFD